MYVLASPIEPDFVCVCVRTFICVYVYVCAGIVQVCVPLLSSYLS